MSCLRLTALLPQAVSSALTTPTAPSKNTTLMSQNPDLSRSTVFAARVLLVQPPAAANHVRHAQVLLLSRVLLLQPPAAANHVRHAQVLLLLALISRPQPLLIRVPSIPYKSCSTPLVSVSKANDGPHMLQRSASSRTCLMN